MRSFLHQRDARFVLFGLDADQTSGRGVKLLAAVFFGSLLIAAVLTPPAYWLVEWWHDRTGSANAAWLLGKGVDVYFDRLRMAAIVLGLPWLMSRCHLWSWSELGLAIKKSAMRAGAWWWLGGLALIFGLALWKNSPTTTVTSTVGMAAGQVLRQSLSALLAGLILGFVEEVIFRGMILRICYTATRRPWLALAAMSAFFAYTHFKVPTSVWLHVTPGVHGDTGFFVAFWTTFGISENFDLAQFTALWLLGLVLGALTLRTGSLWPAIGLHAGLVTAMFFYRGNGLTDGWAAALVLAVILVLMITLGPKERLTLNPQRLTPK
jgi:membrane protease YdiL (CAAX protease family)